MAKKAFIFDLDGVIVDTAKYHFLAWQALAEKLGITFTEEDNEKLKGVSRVDSLEIILKLGNITLSDDEKSALLKEKNTQYLAYIENMDASEILPGVEKTLDFIQKTQNPIVLGSASKNAKVILEKVGLIHYFSSIVDGNDVSKAKPDPEVFLIGAQKAQMAPKDCLVFEDSIAGIEAANIAEMTSIGIGNPSVLTEAKFNFESFTDISEEWLKNQLESN